MHTYGKAKRAMIWSKGSKGWKKHHENADIELLSHMRQFTQELIQLLLPISQLAAAAVVDAETGHYAVDDEEAVFVSLETGGKGVEELKLVLGTGREVSI